MDWKHLRLKANNLADSQFLSVINRHLKRKSVALLNVQNKFSLLQKKIFSLGALL